MNWRRIVRWLLDWLILTVGITAIGVFAGSLLFPILGGLGGSDRAPAELARLGAKNVGFYAFVWAPGVSIVLTVMLEARRRRRAGGKV